DFADSPGWRAAGKIGRVATDRAFQIGLPGLRSLDVAPSPHDVQVGWCSRRGGASVQVWFPDDAHQRGVTAVASAVNAYPRRIGKSAGYRPVRGIGQVILHLAAPFAVAGFDEGAAVASRAAEVDAQYSVAMCCEDLDI